MQISSIFSKFSILKHELLHRDSLLKGFDPRFLNSYFNVLTEELKSDCFGTPLDNVVDSENQFSSSVLQNQRS